MPTVILSILPDVNSTTIAISEDYNIVYQCDIDHSKCDFILLDNIIEQLPFRRDAIIYQLRNDNINILVLDTEVYSNTGGQSSKSSNLLTLTS